MSTELVVEALGYLSAIFVALCGLFWLWCGAPVTFIGPKSFRAYWPFYALLVVGVILRVCFIHEFMGGILSCDEEWSARIQIAGISQYRPVLRGATHFNYVWVSDLWGFVFGTSAEATRYLSVALGLCGTIFLYLACVKLFGVTVALAASGIFSVMLNAVYFSKLGFDVVWVLFLVPLTFLLIIDVVKRPNIASAALVGLIVGFGFFTYPGFFLATLVAVAAYCLSGSPSSVAKMVLAYKSYFTVALVCTLLFCGAVWILHRAFYTDGSILFQGGGNISVALSGAGRALEVVVNDLFYEATSWYLIFPGQPFVEWTYLALAICGAIGLWKRSSRRELLAAILFCILLPLAVTLTGSFPGMRRAIAILPVIAIFAGVGVCSILEAIQRKQNAPFKIISKCLLISALFASPLYQLVVGRVYSQINYCAKFYSYPLVTELVRSRLPKSAIVMINAELTHHYDRQLYEGIVTLMHRYNEAPIDNGIYFANSASEAKHLCLDHSATLISESKSFAVEATLVTPFQSKGGTVYLANF